MKIYGQVVYRPDEYSSDIRIRAYPSVERLLFWNPMMRLLDGDGIEYSVRSEDAGGQWESFLIVEHPPADIRMRILNRLRTWWPHVEGIVDISLRATPGATFVTVLVNQDTVDKIQSEWKAAQTTKGGFLLKGCRCDY